jgi:hypothetical protein
MDFTLSIFRRAAMAQIKGYITVYESSDAGTGKPANTTWQFFVGAQPVSTKNSFFAETVRLALQTNSMVLATFDGTNNLSEVRVAFTAPKTSAKRGPIKKTR